MGPPLLGLSRSRAARPDLEEIPSAPGEPNEASSSSDAHGRRIKEYLRRLQSPESVEDRALGEVKREFAGVFKMYPQRSPEVRNSTEARDSIAAELAQLEAQGCFFLGNVLSRKEVKRKLRVVFRGSSGG